MAARSAAQKAALRKAQLASAKKRKRKALVRNTGRGLVGKKNGSRKKRYKVARYAGGVAAAVAVGYAVHHTKKHLSKNRYSASAVASHRYDKNAMGRKSKRFQMKYHDHSKAPGGGKGIAGSIHFNGRDYRYQAYKHKR